MALYSTENIAHGTRLGIWKKEEPLNQLESVFVLNPTELKAYEKISNEGRKKEWLSTRILLTELLQQRVTIAYTPHRKPFIINHAANISISHSKNFVAIIISAQYFPGIDVEHISSRIEKVKHKFLCSAELEWCKQLSQLTACWCAKEAVFKIHEKELDFHDMLIAPFTLDSSQGSFKTSVLKEGKEGSYLVKYRQIEDDILTYALSKSPLS